MKTSILCKALGMLFTCGIFFISTNDIYGQTTRVELEAISSKWVLSPFGNYTSSWSSSIVTSSVPGYTTGEGTGPGSGNDCSGGSNMRAVYVKFSDLGLPDGTYNFNFGYFKNSGNTNVNDIWMAIGPESKMATIPVPPADPGGMLKVAKFTFTPATSARVQYTSTAGLYDGIKIGLTDAIAFIPCSGSSGDVIWDYIDITPTYPNNNAPTIPNGQVISITENNCTGAVIGNVSASDADMPLALDHHLTYSITAGNSGNEFFIDPISGQIRANVSFNFESKSTYPLTIKVSDNGTPSKSTTNTVTVNINNIVTEITNNPPSFSNQSLPNLQENSNFGTVVGTVVASDPDAGQSLSFRILSGDPNSAFVFNGKDLVVNGAVDYETQSSYSLLVEASDNACPIQKKTATITFNITDVAVETPNGSCVSITGQGNLVPNGNFETTPDATYSGYPYSGTCASGPASWGWAVIDPTPCRSSYVPPTKGGIIADAGGDPNGHYMIIDAKDNTTQIWKSQTIPVTPGITYYFSAWIANINKAYSNPSELAFYVDGVQISVGTTIKANATDHEWSQYFTTWNNSSGKTSVVLSFKNTSDNGSGSGDDMALDNIYFSGSCQGISQYRTSQLPSSLEVCGGGTVTLDSKVNPASTTFTWAKNGTLISGSGPSIVTGSGAAAFGRYTVCYTKSGCSILDTVDVLLCPLPVKLKSFSAWKSGNDNILNWSTASEKDNAYFVVERSSDGIEFIPIGTVNGNGNSSILRTYTFTDEHPLPGNNYYRLKQVDYNGASAYSEVEIVKQEDLSDVTIYPNPNNGSFTIVMTGSEQSYKVDIIDVQGRTVYACSGSTITDKIEVTNLAKGMYIARIYMKDAVIVKKVLVY